MAGTTGAKLTALVAALAVSVLACTPRDNAGVAEDGASADGLIATLGVEAGGEEVQLTLHVTNTTTAPIELEFGSSQRYDFRVSRADGEGVWTWSADRSFAQALGTETLPAGGSLRYEASWASGGRSGEFVATGEVTAMNRAIGQSVRFELMGDE